MNKICGWGGGGCPQTLLQGVLSHTVPLPPPPKILPKYYFAPSPNYSVFPLLCNSFKCTLCHTTSLTCYLLPTEKFYADPKKYALKLQLWIFKQRYLTYIAAMKHIVNTGESAYLQ